MARLVWSAGLQVAGKPYDDMGAGWRLSWDLSGDFSTLFYHPSCPLRLPFGPLSLVFGEFAFLPFSLGPAGDGPFFFFEFLAVQKKIIGIGDHIANF